jgi:hypothetical protein
MTITETAPVAPVAPAPADVPRWRRPKVIEAVGSALFTIYVAWPFLSFSQYVTTYDTVAYTGPNLAYTFRELRAGHFPLWNDAIFNGVPHLGSPQTALMSPLKYLFLPFEVSRALELMAATNLLLIGAGVWWLFSRRLRLRPPAAFVGTVAAMGSGVIMVRATQFEQISVLAFFPWLLVAIDYAAEQGRIRPRAVAAVAAATGLMCSAGHPNQVYVCLPLIALWAGARIADHAGADWRGLLRRALTVGAGAALGVGVASLQLLVMGAQLSASVNTSGRNIMGAADPGAALTPSFIPSALIGQTWSTDPGTSSGSFETLAFVGVTVVLLALLGVGVTLTTKRLRWTGIAMAGSAVLGVLLSLGPECQLDSKGARMCQPGGRLYRELFDRIPGFSQARVPGRWMGLTTFALVILAAIAVDALVRRDVGRRALAIGAGLAAVCVVAMLLRPVEVNDDIGASKLVWVVAAVLTVAAILTLVLGPRRLQLLALTVVVAMVLLELGGAQRYSAARNNISDLSFTQVTGPTSEFLRTKPERSLSLTDTPLDDEYYFNDSLRPNSTMTFGTRTLDGYDGGLWVTQRYVNAVDPLTKDIFNNDLPLSWQIEVPPNRELLARYGVKYIIIDAAGAARVYGIPNPSSPEGNAAGAALVTKGYTGPILTDGGFQVWENPLYDKEAGVYFRTWPVAQDPDTLIHRLGDVTPDQALVPLDGPQLSCDQPCPRQGVDLQRPRPGLIQASVDLDRQGLFVVPEQNASGWVATVDGDPAPIVPTDSMNQGILLSPGHHDVELRYVPPGMKLGLLISVASIIAVVLLAWEPRWLFGRRRKRRVSTSG